MIDRLVIEKDEASIDEARQSSASLQEHMNHTCLGPYPYLDQRFRV